MQERPQQQASRQPDSPAAVQEAKKIIDDFMMALEEAAKEQTGPGCAANVANEQSSATQGVRDPAKDVRADQEGFIALFFANAPRVQGNYLLTEKKKW